MLTTLSRDGRGLLLRAVSGLLGFAEPWNQQEFGRRRARPQPLRQGLLLPQPHCAAAQPRMASGPVALWWDEPCVSISGCSGVTWKITAAVPSSLSARLTKRGMGGGEG